MAVNRFVLNGISYHGHGAINEIPGIVKSKGFKKAFVASDPDLVKFGVTAKVTDLLKENSIEYELYSDIKPNPTIEICRWITCIYISRIFFTDFIPIFRIFSYAVSKENSFAKPITLNPNIFVIL